MLESGGMSTPVKSIVVLTGAGISAESDIRTFRASDGLWQDHLIEDLATPDDFERNPQLVHHFYNLRRQQLLSPAIRPNPAHTALARLQHHLGDRLLLITQNVDNLHERAGSRNVLHMHGELLKMRCHGSGLVFDIREDLSFASVCGCCRTPGDLRADTVWFGEMPVHMPRITQALQRCD